MCRGWFRVTDIPPNRDICVDSLVYSVCCCLHRLELIRRTSMQPFPHAHAEWTERLYGLSEWVRPGDQRQGARHGGFDGEWIWLTDIQSKRAICVAGDSDGLTASLFCVETYIYIYIITYLHILHRYNTQTASRFNYTVFYSHIIMLGHNRNYKVRIPRL